LFLSTTTITTILIPTKLHTTARHSCQQSDKENFMSAFNVLMVTEALLQQMKEHHQNTRSILLLNSNPVFVEKVLQGLPGSFTCDEHISILKCLRHACAGCFSNAKLLTELAIPAAIMQIVTASYASYLNEKEHSYDNPAPSDTTNTETISESFSDSQFSSLFTVAVQVLANYSACRDVCSPPLTAPTLWSLLGVNGFSQLLNIAVSFHSQNGLSATFAALYNCLLVPALGAGEAVASSRQVCCQMALSVVDLQFAEMTASSKTTTTGSSSSSSNSSCNSSNKSPSVHPNVEWFQIVVLHLLKMGQAVRVLQAVKRSAEVLADTAGSSECFSVTMTHEEIIYLCALDTILSDDSVWEDAVECEETFAHMLGVMRHVARLLLSPTGIMTSAVHPQVVTVDANSVQIDEKYAVYLTSPRPPLCGDKTATSSQTTSEVDIDSLTTPAASVCLNLLAVFAALSNSTLGEKVSSFSAERKTIGEVVKQEMLAAGVMNICCSCLTGLNKIKTGIIARDNVFI
jgi:hypothetical protein